MEAWVKAKEALFALGLEDDEVYFDLSRELDEF